MSGGCDFIGLMRKIKSLLREAARPRPEDPELPGILARMAAHFRRLLGGEPEPGTVEDAERALRKSAAAKGSRGPSSHAENGTHGQG